MKKLFITMILTVVICIFCALTVCAKPLELEEIPADLKFADDTVTHFIVIEGEEYYKGYGGTINLLNEDNIAAEFTRLSISTSDLGTKYLTKFIIPSTFNGNTVTYADINGDGENFKKSVYFSNVCGYVKLPSTATSTKDANDRNLNIRAIDFGENSQLTSIPGSFMLNAKKLKRLYNMPTANLSKIDSSAFRGCSALCGDENGQLYINAATIEHKAFDNAMGNVQSIIFGENVSKMADQAFSNGETKNPEVKYIEFKGDVRNINFSQCQAGTYNGSFYFIPGSGSQRLAYTNLVCIVLSHPANQAEITEGVTTFRDFQPNVYFKSGENLVYKSHGVSESPVISYTSFMEKGTLADACPRCQKADVTVLDELFKFKGYSVPENGEIAVSITFIPNFRAINTYEELTGNKVYYGVVAAAKTSLGENVTPLDDEGNAKVLEKGSIIKAPVVNSNYAYVELRIKGFTEEAHKDVMLLLAAYIQVFDADDEMLSLNYLQSAQIANNAFTYVSFNSVNI